jgi:hypothetical protein
MAAAAAAAGGGGSIGSTLLPASLRRQMAEERVSEAAEKQLKEDVAVRGVGAVCERVLCWRADCGNAAASAARAFTQHQTAATPLTPCLPSSSTTPTAAVGAQQGGGAGRALRGARRRGRRRQRLPAAQQAGDGGQR